jgi:PmbA protein
VVQPGTGPTFAHTEETGVAVRTSGSGRSGFAAASGLETGAARRATETALAGAAAAPFDPLPPPRLLGTSPVEARTTLAPRGWATHLCQDLSRSLAEISTGRVQLLRATVCEGAFSWILATGEGFVAAFDGTTGSLLVEATLAPDNRGVWREWFRIPDPDRLDPTRIARQVVDRALLVHAPTACVSGVRDVILHGEVTAHLVAALVPALCACDLEQEVLPALLSPTGELAAPCLTLVDDRLDPDAPIVGPCDGEGLPPGRTLLVENGIPRHRLASYRDAALYNDTPRGSALRLSYRDYPSTGPANLRVSTQGALPPADLLLGTDRALYLLRPIAPLRLDLGSDTYSIQASAAWLEHGRLVGWQPVVEISGSLGLLLRRIDGVGSDLSWYQTERGFVGASTLLVRRQTVVG